MRFMQVDSEWVGILVAGGFILMGLVSLPIAKWFFIGAVLLGLFIALLFRWVRKDKPPQSIGLGLEPPQQLQPSSPDRRDIVPSSPPSPRLSALPA
jgi:hypothetical protein